MARRATAVAEPEPEVEAEVDYTTYADKPATPTMEWFADWLIEEVYGGKLPKDLDEDTFREGVRLGGTLRMEFQRSDMNKTRRAELREQRAEEKAQARAAKEEPEEDEEPAPRARRGRAAAAPAKASTAKAATARSTGTKSTTAKASTAKPATTARRRGRPAAAAAEEPY